MNKRILSLVISFVLAFSVMATAIPVQAKAGKTTTLTMTADKTMAKPGDVIDYTIKLGAVEDLLGIKFQLIIPDGLTFLSSHVPVDVQPVLGATSAEFKEDTKVFLADPEYTGTEELLLMSFSCSVNEGASGSQTVEIYIDDPDNYYDSDGDNIEVVITNHTVNIGTPLPGGDYGDSEKPQASGTCGESASWKLMSGGRLIISGSGATDNYKLPMFAPWYQYREEIKSVVIADTITKIGNNSFGDFINLTYVEVKNPNTEFGASVFSKNAIFTIESLGKGSVEAYANENGYLFVKPQNTDTPVDVEIESVSTYSVVLKEVPGYEYSIDCENWQTSNVFTDLTPSCAYVFYQRIAEDIYGPSVASAGVEVATLEELEAPVIASIVGNIATLVNVEGYEYSVDGVNWQASNVFEIPMNELVYFYQRVADNGSGMPQPMSSPAKGISVSAPTVFVSDSAIYIKPVEGCEYGLEGVLWQQHYVFDEWIIFGETYTVYQRYIGADDVFAVCDEEGTSVVVNGDAPINSLEETHLSWLRNLIVGSVSTNNVATDFNRDFEIDVKDIVCLKKQLGFGCDLGTVGQPYPMALGVFFATVKGGNTQGVYYSYQSPKEGILTVQCISATSGVQYDYTLEKIGENDIVIQKRLSDDGMVDDGLPTLKISVKAGQNVRFVVHTLPNSVNKYQAGDFQFKAFFEEEKVEDTVIQNESITYTITVKDENGTLMPAVGFQVKTEEGLQPIVTTTEGVATIKLKKGTYEARLVLPEGYTSRTTQYYLTENEPSITVVIELIPIVMKDYKVIVEDEDGTKVAGVTITVGGEFKTTDETGSVSFNLQEGSYVATIGIPEGYTSEVTEVPFEDKVELTIVLQKIVEPEPPKEEETTYRVTVVDVTTNVSGTPLSGVAVQFMQDGVQKALQSVTENGVAEVKLPNGKYDVELIFSSGSNFGYVKQMASLTVDNPSVVIPVAEKHDGRDDSVCDNYARIIKVGSTYLETVVSGATDYFLLEFNEPGLYSFTTTSKNAEIAYYGSNTFFWMGKQDLDYENNTFTYNLKDVNWACILGVSGADEYIIQIERVGDTITDNSDIPYTVYTAKKTPTLQNLSLGKLTYVDVSASTSDYTLMLGRDGYYHLGSAIGPIVYVNLDYSQYVSFNAMINGDGIAGGTGLKCRWYEGGTLIKEDYTDCMKNYIAMRDKTTNLYPLTEDLAYMIQKGGQNMGWWDITHPNYLFDSLNLNTEIAWMFACCYEN